MSPAYDGWPWPKITSLDWVIRHGVAYLYDDGPDWAPFIAPPGYAMKGPSSIIAVRVVNRLSALALAHGDPSHTAFGSELFDDDHPRKWERTMRELFLTGVLEPRCAGPASVHPRLVKTADVGFRLTEVGHEYAQLLDGTVL